jgi:hypothetical protein
MNIQGRILAKMSALNTAGVLCSRVTVSPEAMFDLQSEIQVGSVLWHEQMSWQVGSLERQTVFGLPLEVDPRLDGDSVRLEVDA